MSELLITNGDEAAARLATAFPNAHVLPWRDDLHWGPLPDHPDPERVADVRARAMADLAPGMRPHAIRRSFAARDETMRDHAAFDVVSLWFEPDLYDQLQRVQILRTLHASNRIDGVVLVQAGRDLGLAEAAELARLAGTAYGAEATVFDEAVTTWDALTAPTPAPVFDLASRPLRLPHLASALTRLLEDLPGDDGLARSERAILECVAEGEIKGVHLSLGRLFTVVQSRETAPFESDLGFLKWVTGLTSCAAPLLDGAAPPVMPQTEIERRDVFALTPALTAAGRAVLEGRADHIALNGANRHWGGTHLKPGAVWRLIDGRLEPPR